MPGTVQIKDSRYYFAWIFDQPLLPRSCARPTRVSACSARSRRLGRQPERAALVAPRRHRRQAAWCPGRSRDNWGIGYYYDGFSQDLKDALAPAVTLRNEQGLELFYNFALTPWSVLGFDLQVIRPALASATAVIPGMRMVVRF